MRKNGRRGREGVYVKGVGSKVREHQLGRNTVGKEFLRGKEAWEKGEQGCVSIQKGTE